MKTTFNINDPSRDDATMRELLLLADRQEIEPPRDLLDRVRARLHENSVRSPSAAPARATVSWTKKAWFAGAAAAAVVLIAFLFALQPSSIAWSQVVEAVRTLPWIHMNGCRRRRPVAGIVDFVFRETSVPCTTAKWSAMTIIDREFGTSTICRKRSYTAYRRLRRRTSRLQKGCFRRSFTEIPFAKEIYFPGLRIVKQRQWTVDEPGQRWIMYELELKRQCGDPKPPIEIPAISMVIRVNPEKMLPDLESRTISHREDESRDRLRLSSRGPG